MDLKTAREVAKMIKASDGFSNVRGTRRNNGQRGWSILAYDEHNADEIRIDSRQDWLDYMGMGGSVEEPEGGARERTKSATR